MSNAEVVMMHAQEQQSNVVQGPWKKQTRKQIAKSMIASGMPPADVYAQFERESKSTKNFDSSDEVDIFVSFFLKRHRYRDALMVIIGCNMGLRISDIIMLRWKDIERDVYKTVMK